ncbi:MAG TPA: glycoside hydrolase family 11 protein [Polyangiaceae bacterium]
MRDQLLLTLMLSVAFGIGGCQAQVQTDLPSNGGSAGRAAGGSLQGSGGAATAGNAPGSSAGSSASGGNASAGSATGGTNASGAGSAGVSMGGTAALGGSPGAAGSSAGTPSSGGAGTGSGGNASSAGSANGGTAGSAGAATDPPCPVEPPRTGGKQYCSTANGSAGGNYSYDLWSDGKGSGCMTVFGVDGAFKANWMNVGDWIARVGRSFDKSKTYDQLGTFSSDFSFTMTGITAGGFGNVGIYGWTVNPLHEFYIEENWLGKDPNFTRVGSFTIDGEGTYDVMTNTQTNQPNITGTNATFVQFWSVRKTKRQCGHISISRHFDEWAKLGLQLGKMEEVRMSVEGQNNSGTIEFTTATLVVK